MGKKQCVLCFLTVAIAMLSSQLRADWKQAVAYYNQHKYEKAIEELKAVVDSNPNWEPGHRILGLSYFNLKKYEQAESSLARAVQLKSPALSTYLGLAETYAKLEKLNKIPEVLTAGEKYLDAQKDDKQRDENHKYKYDICHLRGSVYFRQKKYSEAARDLTEATKLKASDFFDFYELGVSNYFLGRYNEALQALNKAAVLKPTESKVREYIANIHQKQGAADLKSKQYARAVEHLEKALESNPKDGPTLYNLGMAYLFLNKYDNAEKTLLKAGEVMPESTDVLNRLGFVYEKRKLYSKALEMYNKAYELKKDPQTKASIERVNGALTPGQQKS